MLFISPHTSNKINILYMDCSYSDFGIKTFYILQQPRVFSKVNRFISSTLMTHFGSDKSLMRHGLLSMMVEINGFNFFLVHLTGLSVLVCLKCSFAICKRNNINILHSA